jgi:hypothetical protein
MVSQPRITSMGPILDALDAAIDSAAGLEHGPDRDVWEGRRICLEAVREAMASPDEPPVLTATVSFNWMPQASRTDPC